MNTGDLEPNWIVDITAAAGTDFTLVESWAFHAYRETTNGKVEVFHDTDPDVVPGATANVVTVTHTWTAGQTDVPGPVHGVPIAVWPGGKEQSFPVAEPVIIGTDATN